MVKSVLLGLLLFFILALNACSFGITDNNKHITLKNELDLEMHISSEKFVTDKTVNIQPHTSKVVDVRPHEGLYFTLEYEGTVYSGSSGYVQDTYKYTLLFKYEDGKVVGYLQTTREYEKLDINTN